MSMTSLQEDDLAHVPEAIAAFDHDTLPTLYRDPGFLGMAATQFFGAFNDNLFKQLILLLATPTVVASSLEKSDDRQWAATFVFAAAFLIFSGFAGYLSDRFSKRRIVIFAKVAEIMIMIIGTLGFYFYDYVGFYGMLAILFMMGTHSAFFGPAKYGILPEMIRARDLPRANGVFLMLTFLAIIFGVVLAGALLDIFDKRVWIASFVCIAIALCGTGTSIFVRRLPAAQPKLRYSWRCWTISREMVDLMRRDRDLILAVFVISVFWMVAGIAQPTLNALGKAQLGLPSDFQVSTLPGAVGVGIAVGCLLGGYYSRSRINPHVVTAGAIGMTATMALLSLPGGAHRHFLGYWGSLPVLLALGVFTGMFVVPLQVLLQSRPPREEKGRMIATMNQFTWIGVILSALLYFGCIETLKRFDGPQNLVFAVAAVIMLPIAILYRAPNQALVEK